MIGILHRVLVLLVGYFFGMIQTAYFYGKANGIDIREHGSGNAGTTNTLRVLGKKAGFVVFVGDICKSFIPVLVIGFIMDSINPELKYLAKLYIGLGAVLGHNFPFYLGFKGGKGIAATAGMILGFYWLFVPIDLVLFFGTLAVTHYVSLSSLVLMAGFFIEILLPAVLHMGPFANISNDILIEMCIVAFAFTALAYVRHLENIKRLISHNERKTYIFKKKD